MRKGIGVLGAILMTFGFVLSCSKKNEAPIIVPDQTSGRITQASEIKNYQTRLHFRFDHKGTRYLGQEAVESFSVDNQISIPKEHSHQYSGLILADDKGRPLYSQVKKNFFNFESEHVKEFQVYQYKGYFYVDVPQGVALDSVRYLYIQELVENTILATVEILDVKTAYLPKLVKRGWDGSYSVFKVKGDQPAENSYDIVILAEGFDKSEISLKSKKEMMATKFGKTLLDRVLPAFDQEPFKSMTTNLNIWVVATASEDSGADIPSEKIIKNTVYDATFDTFCSRRSLTVKNQERALQLASKTPFDQILVMVNSEVYGGQGSDIATFSMNERATYLIRHELGHSIGLLADEYSYFSDVDTRKACEDHQIEQYVIHDHKRWGRNGFFEEDQYLAPNLTLSSNPANAKWSQFLNSSSPVVFFDYPQDYNLVEVIGGGTVMTVETEIVPQMDRPELLVLLGTSKSINELSGNITQVELDGQVVGFQRERVGELVFVKIPGVSKTQGEKVLLKMRFQLSEVPSEGSIKHLASNQHFVSLPSRTFRGGNEIGLFQGATPSMEKVFRSSYDSIMNSGAEFDTVQVDAYLRLMDYFKAEVGPAN